MTTAPNAKVLGLIETSDWNAASRPERAAKVLGK